MKIEVNFNFLQNMNSYLVTVVFPTLHDVLHHASLLLCQLEFCHPHHAVQDLHHT